jgi:membrane-bound lytic murein transglycosylase B
MRFALCAVTLTIAAGAFSICLAAQPADQSTEGKFQRFLDGVWPDAQAAGITRATFDIAFAGVAIDRRVIALIHKQPEYGKPIKAYVDDIASPVRVEAGRGEAAEWAKTLAAVEQKFAVDPAVILGIWGIETSFGNEKDKWDVIRSLATLAYASDRGAYFRTELISALKMLQQGDMARDKMLGSWSGAMGQPQFMPSGYLQFAVNFSGNGRPDIWTTVPDVLASIANYLHLDGWNPNLPWGFEVAVPVGFDYRRSRGSFPDWGKLGVTRADGAAMPSAGDAIMYFPTGASGPAFLVTSNFNVIKLYNNSDVYALAVAYLGDRIRGGGPIHATWPKSMFNCLGMIVLRYKRNLPLSVTRSMTSRPISISI